MKQFKIILPALAFVFAIALSFASVNIESSPVNDYLDLPGGCEEIEEVACNTSGTETCRVIHPDFGGPHDVYDALDGTQCADVKSNITDEPIIILPEE